MPNLKDIRKRIASVNNTKKITRAMKLVSTAKLKRAQDGMSELRPYAAKYRELLASLAGQLGGEAAHALMERREEVRRIGVFVLSSDRGMCGGFNAQVQKRLLKLRREQSAELVIYPLGRRVVKFTDKAGFTIGRAFGEITTSTSVDAVRAVTETLVEAFLGGEVDEVILIFNEFRSVISQTVAQRPLLPVSAPTDAAPVEAAGDLIYEPDQRSLLAYVVPRFVEVQVRQAILESIAGEHAARMNAMSNATDNATEMIKALTLQANRARQAAITKELMEIIGGAEAI